MAKKLDQVVMEIEPDEEMAIAPEETQGEEGAALKRKSTRKPKPTPHEEPSNNGASELTPEAANELVQQTHFARDTRRSIEDMQEQLVSVNAQLAQTSQQVLEVAGAINQALQALSGGAASPQGQGQGGNGQMGGGGVGSIMDKVFPYLELITKAGMGAPQESPDKLADAMNTIAGVFKVFTAMQNENTRAAVENLRMLRQLSGEVMPPTRAPTKKKQAPEPTPRNVAPSEPALMLRHLGSGIEIDEEEEEG